ncbi:MAG: AbrB/MazE/SpoVT family DNA-binding domain-containing protein [Clostridia bacterium]|nr:AbrB/MazE/SpoVT family DNA-binding domain-containing protein [Clostridia bacterium]
MRKMYRVLGKRGRVTIPFEIRERVGFGYNDVLSFTEASDGRTVIVRREKICDDCIDIETIPIKDDKVTLFDFLNSLSPAQQKAALIHLTVNWAESQGKWRNLYE